MNTCEDWDVSKYGPLSIQAVNSLYQPAYKYRVQEFVWQPHTPFLGASVPWCIYVLSGACTVTLSNTSQTITIGAGQYVCLAEGKYTMSYLELTKLIKVIELPERVWSQQIAAQPGVQADVHEKP